MTDQPDRLTDAFQTLYDLAERYGGERTEQQRETWWQIENAMEELAEAGIAEGRRQATEGWEREYRLDLPSGWAPIHASQAPLYRGYPQQHRLVGPWEPAEQPEEDDRA